MDRHRGGPENGAVVDALVGHEMDHHAGRRALAAAGLLVRPGDGVRAGQLARERRVEVDDTLREAAEEAHREDAHPSGEDDDVGICGLDDVGEARVVVGSGLAVAAGEVGGGDSGGGRPLQGEGVVTVGDHVDDGTVDLPGGAGVDDRLQVAPGARKRGRRFGGSLAAAPPIPRS